MSRPRRRRQLVADGIWVARGGFLAGLVTALALEVLGEGLVGQLSGGQLRTVMAVCVVALLVLFLVQPDDEPDQWPDGVHSELPPSVELVGRDHVVDAVVARARQQAIVLVRGPTGIGASAVAVQAAHVLAPEPDRQRYVDLRGPDPSRPESARRVAIRVLRTLSLVPGRIRSLDDAAAKVAATLRDSGQVLVVDNVTEVDQVAWIARPVPGAVVVIAGDISRTGALADLPEVHVRPLDPEAGLELLRRQGDDPPPDPAPRPRLLGRLRRLVAPADPPTTDSVAARIARQPAPAQTLAERYLKHPRVVIEMGRWLADNPGVTVAELLDDLNRHQGNSKLDFILHKQLDGASEDARRLLGLLAHGPVAELTEAAAAALADESLHRTNEHLTELADRSLVEWIRPSRCRVSADARMLAGPVSPTDLARSTVRLAEYFADLAEAHAETLVLDQGRAERRQAEEWFQVEDVTLLEILQTPAPPPPAGPHLWRIADALEAWFLRENRLADRRVTAEAMVTAARTLGDATACTVGELRLSAVARAEGDLEAAHRHLQHARERQNRTDAWPPQLHAGGVVQNLMTGDDEAAESELDHCRRKRPRRDTVGRVLDLLNLATIRIGQRRYDAAYAELRAVLDLTDSAELPSREAHARELLGLVAWYRRHGDGKATIRDQATDEDPEWIEEWRLAEHLYERTGNDLGQARCLLHHGTALIAAGNSGKEVVEKLKRSLELRGDRRTGLGVALAHLYLAELGVATEPEDVPHRDAGLAALSPWNGQTGPAEVDAARKRLHALPDNP